MRQIVIALILNSYEQEKRFLHFFEKTLDLPPGGRPILIAKIWPIFFTKAQNDSWFN
jgi:hypothetical protein